MKEPTQLPQEDQKILKWSEDLIRIHGPKDSGRVLLVRPDITWTVLRQEWLSMLDSRVVGERLSEAAISSHESPDEATMGLLVNRLVEAGFLTAAARVGETEESVTRCAQPEHKEDPRLRQRWDQGQCANLLCLVTQACNLKCPYCVMPTEEGTGPKHMSLETARQFALVFGKSSKCRVTVSGGEPLVHPHLFDIIGLLRPVAQYVALNTNGTLIDSDMASRLADVVDLVVVSIDGHSAEVHDRYRGQGTFEKAIRAVRMLKDTGKCQVQIRTVSVLGCDDEKVAELARSLEVEFHIQGITARGRGKDFFADKTEHGFEDGLCRSDDYIRLRRDYREDWSRKDFAQWVRKNLRFRQAGYTGCPGLKWLLAVSTDGGVYPCPISTNEEFKQRYRIGSVWDGLPILRAPNIMNS